MGFLPMVLAATNDVLEVKVSNEFGALLIQSKRKFSLAITLENLQAEAEEAKLESDN